LRHKGVRVIGTVSSDDKAEIAKANGCDHVINYKTEDFERSVAEITGGKGVDVVFDSVGADTFTKSLSCLRPRGTVVSFGESSGPVQPLNVATLGAKGSLHVTRPSIAHYTANRTEYEAAAENLFAAIAAGVVKASSILRYPLADAQKAHSDMEARRTTGSVVLLP
jgi:NADPH2:quinone reductase